MVPLFRVKRNRSGDLCHELILSENKIRRGPSSHIVTKYPLTLFEGRNQGYKSTLHLPEFYHHR